MKKILLLVICSFLLKTALCQILPSNIQYLDKFNNTNHPQIAYWFINKEMLAEDAWKKKIDSLVTNNKYTLVFLTARNGVDFFEPSLMKPYFLALVNYAHSKGLQIGLQLWGTPKNTSESASERAIVENEIQLNENGSASLYSKAKHIRAQSGKPFKSDLLKAFVFKKSNPGFYEPNSVVDITNQCVINNQTDSSLNIQIKVGEKFAGQSVYVMTQHYYKVSSNYSQEAINKFVSIMDSYKDVPFDGIGLDEYTNLKLFAIWELQKANELMRERLYSLDMAKKYKAVYRYDLERALFDMRYAPLHQPGTRIKAINTYMDIMRKASLQVEAAVYDHAKTTYGSKTFVGLHNSHHNTLDGDEVWQTGINWWNVKRDYAHTDEHTPTPTQMGILYGYPKNMLYNMFYDKSINTIQEKAYQDLKYNIRTHYHAINDVQRWGVSVEQPAALEKINPVENCARLLNRFNPSIPDIKLLVVFGREALMNWYPDSSKRGLCDVNDKLQIEEKAEQIWKAGYLNALVPTDVIEDGRLVVNQEGKPVYNGQVFDAIVYLYPEFAKESSLLFLEQYLNKKGKLMVEGSAQYNFLGQDIQTRWNKIIAKATVNEFNIQALPLLGISKNNFPNALKMQDGSWVFSDFEKFISNTPAQFFQTIVGTKLSGKYAGYAAIQIKKEKLVKFAATAFQDLSINGKIVLQLNKPSDIYIEEIAGKPMIQLVDKTVQILINNLDGK